MLTTQINIEYKGEHEDFEVEHSFGQFSIETSDLKMIVDKKHFEELREKINKIHSEVF
jgi:hypothetical protein